MEKDENLEKINMVIIYVKEHLNIYSKSRWYQMQICVWVTFTVI